MSVATTFFEHIEELRQRLVRIVITVFAVFVFTFTFGPKPVTVRGRELMLPYPTITDSISSRVYDRIWADLIPQFAEGPTIQSYASLTGGMLLLAEISVFLGILIGMPMIVYQLHRFIAPGLYPHERRLVVITALPAVFLFLCGAAFGYLVVIPFIIEFLLEVIFGMGIEPLIIANKFIPMVLVMMFAFGVVFELPIIMVGVTRLGVVPPRKWLKNWRWAMLAFIIFGAIITPDGSGITQMLVALPMIALYFIGYGFSRIAWRKFQAQAGKVKGKG